MNVHDKIQWLFGHYIFYVFSYDKCLYLVVYILDYYMVWIVLFSLASLVMFSICN